MKAMKERRRWQEQLYNISCFMKHSETKTNSASRGRSSSIWFSSKRSKDYSKIKCHWVSNCLRHICALKETTEAVKINKKAAVRTQTYLYRRSGLSRNLTAAIKFAFQKDVQIVALVSHTHSRGTADNPLSRLCYMESIIRLCKLTGSCCGICNKPACPPALPLGSSPLPRRAVRLKWKKGCLTAFMRGCLLEEGSGSLV